MFNQRLYSHSRLHSTLQNVIYCLTCPGSSEKYIGKTDHNLFSGLIEQVSRDDQSMYQHLPKCKHCNDIVKLIKLRDRSR